MAPPLTSTPIVTWCLIAVDRVVVMRLSIGSFPVVAASVLVGPLPA
ncbi:hypothetical protein GCM10020358_82890 [Amorphoplanes nipponensis]